MARLHHLHQVSRWWRWCRRRERDKGGGVYWGWLALISHDEKRAGSNIGDRANCDRQRRSFVDARDHEGFIGCPFFICAPAPLSKLVDDRPVSRSLHFLELFALLSRRSRRFFLSTGVYFCREIFLGCSIIGGGVGKSSVVNILDIKGDSLDKNAWVRKHCS